VPASSRRRQIIRVDIEAALLSRWPLFCGRLLGLANSLVRFEGWGLHFEASRSSLSIMPDVFDFTRLGVSACRENAKRRFRRDREPVAEVTRGPAAIVKLGPEPVRFRFMRFPGFRFVGLAVAEHQYLCAHLPLRLCRRRFFAAKGIKALRDSHQRPFLSHCRNLGHIA
jgi:hypothetical protein